MLIKGLKEYKQETNQEIKIINFTDNITIFLRDITCFNKIQMILILYENGKIS